MLLYALLALLALVYIVGSAAIEADHSADPKKVWRGFLIGGGTTALVAWLAFFYH
jgi:hypothetical protein